MEFKATVEQVIAIFVEVTFFKPSPGNIHTYIQFHLILTTCFIYLFSYLFIYFQLTFEAYMLHFCSN